MTTTETLGKVAGSAWRRIVRTAAVVDTVVFAGTAAVLTDVEAGLFAVGLAAGVLLLRFRRGMLGLVALGLLFTDTAGWMLPGAVTNLRSGAGFGATALPAVLGVVSVAGLVAVIGALTRRGEGLARPVATTAAVLLVAGLATAAFASPSRQRADGGIAVRMKDLRFSPDAISARAGRIGVTVSNGDLFWHTFTIRELGVNVRVPVKGERRATFRAPPGTYEFVCAIPGHEQAGMRGRLTVE